MSESQETLGPDLTQGVAIADVPDGGFLVGHVGGENLLVVRCGEEFFAVTDRCSHYGAPLHEGLIDGDTVRCPWHHACFSLRSGAAIAAPAYRPIATWTVTVDGGRLVVDGVREEARPRRRSEGPESVVIVGGGAAGSMAAETLRREGYDRPVVIVSDDASAPYDRPNISKDYLAGSAPEEWMPLREEEFYRSEEIELRLRTRVAHIHPSSRRVVLHGGKELHYGALLLATGADPVRLTVPGAEKVLYLRTLADSRAIIARAAAASRAVVIGASFVGLEVAAALVARGLDVTVVAPDAVPLGRTLGEEVGALVRTLHEEHGVRFRLGERVEVITTDAVVTSGGAKIGAELVVAGIGVRPALALALSCGARVNRGVVVDQYLETSVGGVFAAGDCARWPDPHSGERIRAEHWNVARGHGQTAARNILGHREPYDAVPFFWSAHYDTVLACVGHASRWDRLEVSGSLEARDARVDYLRDGALLSVVTVGRDRESLEVEAAMECEVRGESGIRASPRAGVRSD